MMNIGCHLSVANGYRRMGEEALSIKANTFQFFSRNPRGSQMRALDEADIGAQNINSRRSWRTPPIP